MHARPLAFAVLAGLATAAWAAQPPPRPRAEGPDSTPYTRDPSGVYTRTVFRGREAGLEVEIRRLSLGPGRSAKGVRLPGGAVLEVFSGEGSATLEGRTSGLKLGSTLAVDEGTSFDLVNTGTRPLLLRVILLRGQTR